MDDIAMHRDDWQTKEELAERMIPLIGSLNRNSDVVTSLHGHRLLGLSTTGILEVHERVAQLGHGQLSLTDTLAVLEALREIGPGASSLDVARLVEGHAASGADLTEYLREVLAPAIGAELAAPVDIVLYGFGRIGRLLARIIIAHTGGGSGLRLRAIVVRRGAENDLVKRASLLLRDSVHGRFAGTVDVDEENSQIIANGTRIQVIYSDDPATVDYTAYGIHDAIIVDNTGRWRDEEGLSRHLEAKGAARVLLTAPGKGELKNIVHGINDCTIEDDDRIVSAASCTTNAITPVLKAIDEAYGIVRGHVETVHSFTNDQNLIDNFHKGDRRGRSAVLNMVIAETGAAKAVARALPELAGKLTGSAIRVPTPDVSLAVLHLSLENRATKDQLNDYLRRVSLHSKLRQQIDYIESPEVVSTDFVGSHRAGIVDGLATIANDRDVVLYVWYDNEYGYSCQVVRVLEVMAGAHPVVLPVRREVTLES
ncbi:NADPH-dependent glyceraldehyde-3-phosphate dehydrogenase [Microbacterium esteraromaticum]|uniref:NADPH-dependent glyceraldehyde-3-phosphate dehydrogenase n=1 Tax=Microbacterium esteraromaticum TaxID=57043 RepID=A0A1R4J9R5_9MICO|nr:glyceraldehyde-3-phosphate dehydrogenase [Microbacterium esteraromaticum]SJN28545.1 NADPH-dependent glyceraldehyde-3-phosphate dehydrogenase [Microbacterium esteraromaticum]